MSSKLGEVSNRTGDNIYTVPEPDNTFVLAITRDFGSRRNDGDETFGSGYDRINLRSCSRP